MSGEMYPNTPFVDDSTRHTISTEMEKPSSRANTMMLRASQSMEYAKLANQERQMASKALYYRKPDLDQPGAYILEKFDMDLVPLDTYSIEKARSTEEWICSCPARTVECRHARMMPIFDRAFARQDALFNEVSAGGKFQTFLQYDGKMFDWVRGPQIEFEEADE